MQFELPKDEGSASAYHHYLNITINNAKQANEVILQGTILNDSTAGRDADYGVFVIKNANTIRVLVYYGRRGQTPRILDKGVFYYTPSTIQQEHGKASVEADKLIRAKASKNYRQVCTVYSTGLAVKKKSFNPTPQLPRDLPFERLVFKDAMKFVPTGTDVLEYYPDPNRIMIMSIDAGGIAVYNASGGLHDMFSYEDRDLIEPTLDLMGDLSNRTYFVDCYLTDVSTYRILGMTRRSDEKQKNTWDIERGMLEYLIGSLVDGQDIYDKFTPLNLNPFELFSSSNGKLTLQPDDVNARIPALIYGREEGDRLFLDRR